MSLPDMQTMIVSDADCLGDADAAISLPHYSTWIREMFNSRFRLRAIMHEPQVAKKAKKANAKTKKTGAIAAVCCGHTNGHQICSDAVVSEVIAAVCCSRTNGHQVRSDAVVCKPMAIIHKIDYDQHTEDRQRRRRRRKERAPRQDNLRCVTQLRFHCGCALRKEKHTFTFLSISPTT